MMERRGGRIEQTLSTESSENQVHVFDSMNHSDRVEEPAMIIDVCQNIDWIYGPGVFARFIRVFNTPSACGGVIDWKEVMAMKRFMVPRVAHCGDGH